MAKYFLHCTRVQSKRAIIVNLIVIRIMKSCFPCVFAFSICITTAGIYQHKDSQYESLKRNDKKDHECDSTMAGL